MINGTSAIALGISVVLATTAWQGVSDAKRVDTCPLTPEQLEILSHMSLVYLDDGAGNAVNKTIRITGVNVQVVNGLGETATVNGVGNVIVGYNELHGSGDERTGSHCVVVGRELNYSSYGGQVLGWMNTIADGYASVLGGDRNEALGFKSVVAGGSFSTADDDSASVFGGHNNFAFGPWSTVAGGHINTAVGTESTVSGGWLNVAIGPFTSVSGGKQNLASGECAAIAGGRQNEAMGDYSAVSGGTSNTTTAADSTVSGGSGNETLHVDATVSGGCGLTTSASCEHVP